MTPALESPKSQSLNGPGKGTRRNILIVPAIPRSLERRPQPKTNSPRLKESVPVPTAAESEVSHGQGSSVPAEKIQNEFGNTTSTESSLELAFDSKEQILGTSAFHGAEISPVALTHSADVCDNTADVSNDFKIEKHGSKLPPPLSSRESQQPIAESSDCSSTGVTQDPAQGSHRDPLESTEENVCEQEQKNTQQPLRATALSFHASSTPPSYPNASPTTSTHDILNVACPPSPPQPTYPTNTRPSLPQPAHPGFGHAHNISFYPSQPISSNDPSSPARSFYQGYAYGPDPQEYVPHAHTSHTQPYQLPPPPYVFPDRKYQGRSPYDDNNPLYPVFGSQAPLTPSVTPLDGMPKQWRFPNEYPTKPLDQGTPIDHRVEAYNSRYRSPSHSTLKTDTYLSREPDSSSNHPQPLASARHDLEHWRISEINATQSPRIGGVSDGAPLLEHLLLCFNDGKYADSRLIMTHDTGRSARTEWFLSSILIAQSRTLSELLETSTEFEGRKKALRFRLSDRFITPTSMELALRTMYGLFPSTFSAPSLSGDSNRTAQELLKSRMSESLAYAASGCLLQLQEVVLRGLQVASDILNWDNLEAALSFGLESEREWSLSSAVIPAYTTLRPFNSEPSPSSHTLFTPSSSSGPWGSQSNHPSTTTSSPESYPRPPPHSAYDLLLHCLNFIVSYFPTSWEFDPSARPLADVDRLPVTAESRSPLSKSRLSSIQFGDHPSEAAAKSSDRNVLISTILLSLPFSKLDYLVGLVGKPVTRQIVSIIKERERRRHIVLQSKSVSWSERQGAVGLQWSEAGYEELVITDDDGKSTISRRYIGIADDTANGYASDR